MLTVLFDAPGREARRLRVAPAGAGAERAVGVVSVVGGGSSFFSAEPGAIAATGAGLGEQAGLVGAGRGYGVIGGLGNCQAVEAAAAGFRAGWDGSLLAWQASLESLGSATTGAGSAIAGTDAALGAAWSGSAMGPW